MNAPVEMSLQDRVNYFKEIELETQVLVVSEPSDAVKIAAIQSGHRNPPPDQTQGTYLGLVNEDKPDECTVKIATPGHGIRFFGLKEILAVNALETEEQAAYRQAKLMLDAIIEDPDFCMAMMEGLKEHADYQLRLSDEAVLGLIRAALRAGREYAERMQKETALATRTGAPQEEPPDSPGSALAAETMSDMQKSVDAANEHFRTGDDVLPDEAPSPAIEAVERLARATGARFPGPEADTPAPTPEGADQAIDERPTFDSTDAPHGE